MFALDNIYIIDNIDNIYHKLQHNLYDNEDLEFLYTVCINYIVNNIKTTEFINEDLHLINVVKILNYIDKLFETKKYELRNNIGIKKIVASFRLNQL